MQLADIAFAVVVRTAMPCRSGSNSLGSAGRSGTERWDRLPPRHPQAPAPCGSAIRAAGPHRPPAVAVRVAFLPAEPPLDRHSERNPLPYLGEHADEDALCAYFAAAEDFPHCIITLRHKCRILCRWRVQ
jgi:hypothetical protein